MLNLPDLLVSRKHHFGLSISRTSLRAVEVNKQGIVTSMAEVLLPDGIFEEGVLIKKEDFVNALKTLLSKTKFSTVYTAVCFSEVYAYSREYNVPRLSEKDIGEAISWNIKDLVPYPVEDIYFDWKVLETTETEIKTSVVVVNKNVLDPLLEALVTAGLKPLSFEPGTSAIAKLLVLEPEQSVLITEINHKGAYVTLVNMGKALFTTVISYTKEDTGDTFLKSIVASLTEIANFYKNKGVIKNAPLSVVLTGELATDEWAKALSQVSSYPVKILKTSQVSPAFNKAYAVAVSTITSPNDQQSINLLPAHTQAIYDHERSTAFYTSLFIRSLIFMICILLVAIGAFAAVTLERQRLVARSTRLASSTTSQNSQVQRLLLLNGHAQAIAQLAPLRQTPRDTLMVLRGILSEDIIVTQLEYDDAKLVYTLQGTAKDRVALLNFREKLEQTGEFAKITLPLDSLESPQNIKFMITFITKK